MRGMLAQLLSSVVDCDFDQRVYCCYFIFCHSLYSSPCLFFHSHFDWVAYRERKAKSTSCCLRYWRTKGIMWQPAYIVRMYGCVSVCLWALCRENKNKNRNEAVNERASSYWSSTLRSWPKISADSHLQSFAKSIILWMTSFVSTFTFLSFTEFWLNGMKATSSRLLIYQPRSVHNVT